MRLTKLRWSLLGAPVLGVLGSLALLACGEDGVTPSCPEVPLYDIHDEDWLTNVEVQDKRREAIDAGCMTELGEAQAPTAEAGPD